MWKTKYLLRAAKELLFLKGEEDKREKKNLSLGLGQFSY